jgi:hypothetical protein
MHVESQAIVPQFLTEQPKVAARKIRAFGDPIAQMRLGEDAPGPLVLLLLEVEECFLVVVGEPFVQKILLDKVLIAD